MRNRKKYEVKYFIGDSREIKTASLKFSTGNESIEAQAIGLIAAAMRCQPLDVKIIDILRIDS